MKLETVLNPCGECGCADYDGAHLPECQEEDALETCGTCEEWYVNTSSPYARDCACKEDEE